MGAEERCLLPYTALYIHAYSQGHGQHLPRGRLAGLGSDLLWLELNEQLKSIGQGYGILFK